MSSNRRRSRDDSESAQRERLAKARRERERKARANLAAKARGESPAEGEGAEAGEEPQLAEKAAGDKAERAQERKEPRGTEGSRSERRPSPAGAKAARAPERDADRRRAGGRKRRGDRGARPAGVLAAAGGIAKDVRAWVVATAPRVGGLLLRLVLAFFTAFFAAVALLINLALAAWAFVRGPLRAGLERLDRTIRFASRAVTPARTLTAVVAGALVLLALSQFADYRSISIGNDTYAPGIQTVAPPPVTETDVTGSAHGYVMVPLAAIGLLLLGAAVIAGRRRLCGVLALIGLAAVVVALVHDRPTGLDPGDRPQAYEGVAATLVGGFYAQIAAGVVIVASSLLLARALRAGAESAVPARDRPARLRRPRLRRRARVQGARA